MLHKILTKFRETSNPNKKPRPPKKGWFGLKFIAAALAIGIISYTVFPQVALSTGLITSDQYVTLTTKFYEEGFKVIENGLKVIPSILSTQK